MLPKGWQGFEVIVQDMLEVWRLRYRFFVDAKDQNAVFRCLLVEFEEEDIWTLNP